MEFTIDKKQPKWKYYGTIDHVFWTNQTIDKPSKKYVDNLQFEEIKMSVNVNNFTEVEIQIDTTKYNLIKIVNVDDEKKTIYYRKLRINGVANNSYNMTYEIDYWCMYSLKLLEQDVDVLVDRHQDYDDEKYLEFNDELLDSLDLNYTQFKAVNNYFETNISNNLKTVLSRDKLTRVLVNQRDTLNSCFALVVADNQDLESSYLVFPIFGRYSSIKCTTWTGVLTSAKQTITDNLQLNNVYKTNVFNQDIMNLFNNNDLDNLTMTINVGRNILPNVSIDLTDQIRRYGLTNIGIDFEVRRKNSNTYLYIVKIWYVNNYVEQFSIESNEFANEAYFDISITKNYLTQSNFNNSFYDLYSSITKAYPDKLKGLYIIPNALNMNKYWKQKPFSNGWAICFDMKQHGLPIDVELFDFELDNNLVFNNSKPLFKKIVDYYNVKWFDNNIGALYLKDNKLTISGLLTFTNTFNLLSTNNKIHLGSQVITFPSEQPLKIDKYNSYVVNNMNSVNTGYAIQKQQSILSGLKGGINSLIGGVLGTAMGGNALGVMSGIAGVGNTILSTKLGLENYERQVRAKYADLRKQLGNELLFSATSDIVWNSELVKEPEQFDMLYRKELTDDSIMQLNNTLLLNGVYNPKYFKLNQLPNTTQHLGFKYAKLNSTNFNQIFSRYINEPLNVKEQILAQLCEFRIWDKVPSID